MSIEKMQFLPIRRNHVDSDAMISLGYAPERCELDIEYPSRDVYRYFQVPREEYDAFIGAESLGEYLNTVFKPKKYHYIRMKEGRKIA